MGEFDRSLSIQIQYACGQCVFKVKGRRKFSQSSLVGLCHHCLCYWVIFFSLEHTISNVIIPNWLCFVNIDCVTLQLSRSCCVRFFDRINRIGSECKERECVCGTAELVLSCQESKEKRTRKTVRQNDCALFKRFIYSDAKVHVRHHEPRWMCYVSGFSEQCSFLPYQPRHRLLCITFVWNMHIFFVTRLLYLCEWRRVYFCGDTINS